MAARRVIVLGAGAAGLLAAGEAASHGAETILLERMDRPGRKLRLTGNQRCNLTHRAPLPEFIEHFGPSGVFLRQAFARFFHDELLALLAGLGVPAVTEADGRVFPASESAEDVAERLVAWVRERGAVVRTGRRAVGLAVDGERVTGVRVARSTKSRRDAAVEEVPADAVVLATGGASYPQTGSTGDGYRMAAAIGHTVAPIRPALVPLIAPGIGARLQGLSLAGVAAELLVNRRAIARAAGELLFTHYGLSGPLVLSLSGRAVDALRAKGVVELAIDLHPELDGPALDARLRQSLEAHGRRKVATVLAGMLPRRLVAVCAAATGIDPEKPAHQVTAADRRALRDRLKSFRIEISGHRPLAEAIITAGGVSLREVDPRTMASRRIAGLYFCGEILDLAADTGGFNLQAAFSTGWLAGRCAAGGEQPPHRRRM
jgi:predicted Rossmann fold flavoprotein